MANGSKKDGARRGVMASSCLILIYIFSGAEIDRMNLGVGLANIARPFVVELSAVVLWLYFALRYRIADGRTTAQLKGWWKARRKMAIYAIPEVEDEIKEKGAISDPRLYDVERLFPNVKVKKKMDTRAKSRYKAIYSPPIIKAWWEVIARTLKHIVDQDEFWDRAFPWFLIFFTCFVLVLTLLQSVLSYLVGW